jgi:hypothetical protein
MKGTRFLSMRTTLVVGVLALVLVAEAGFISVAWAKPPFAETKTSYGYAKLTDTTAYVIQSDDGRQYIDKNVRKAGGEDMVEITTKKATGEYVKSTTILGIVNDPYRSSRRVRFLFDIGSGTRLIEYPKAVYDILLARGTPDGTVHFRVVDDTTDATKDNVAFIIDPGYAGTDPNAITQTTVNGFYGDDIDEDYQLSVNGHVIYYLGYQSGIEAVGTNPTWTFAPSGGTTLYVKKKDTLDPVPLATYASVPFQLTISLKSLAVSAAPRKHSTLSTAWGEIRAK